MKYNAEALERLSRWIEKQGWSKREFARRVGIHETNVSKGSVKKELKQYLGYRKKRTI